MQIRAYLISLTAAAFIVAVIQTILVQHSAVSSVMKLLTGLFMVITLIVPLKTVDISNCEDLLSNAQAYAEEQAAVGNEYRLDTIGHVIKKQTEAYICDKAVQLGATLEIEVILSEEDIMTPWEVHIRGDISPYAKKALQSYIADTIGIPKERQLWS
jgi:stage III sporulation protein AF